MGKYKKIGQTKGDLDKGVLLHPSIHQALHPWILLTGNVWLSPLAHQKTQKAMGMEKGPVTPVAN